MGHGNKIPTIKTSKNPNRSIAEIVKERKKVVKREVVVERPPMWGKTYWKSYPVEELNPEQRKHFKKVLRKEVRK